MKISVSTVTPVYCGEKYLRDLVAEIEKIRGQWERADAPMALVESIFVDDGSIDSSSEVLAQISAEYPWVRVLSLSRNYGQHSATVAGLCHSSSDWVVTLDEDLQHKPADIDQLFRAQVNNAADVVYAAPFSPAHGKSWRDLSSKVVKKILAKLTRTPQIRFFNSFRLIRGSIARAAASSSSSQTYLDIAISWFTKSAVTVAIELKDNRFIDDDESGYSLAGLINHARRLMVSSSFDIASKGLFVGVMAIILAVAAGATAIIQKILVPESVGVVGWASLVSLITFLGGVIIMILCIILEYVSVLVTNQLGRPTFFTVDRSNDSALVAWFRK
ncbi:glycosyltransferase [Arenicella xantha]|uniref:Glycosyltransferase involved in cell wall biosynthesis n=1 Tax=Arenicella xantha TaxID=644221 RepID=A0A395JS14_9GAMM|nr:glycosyltransferase [Arenicella xantha]RBP51490.1 glycosyltransferase involved in cell wall biosynthesis [Arenicella xantha]